MTPTFDKIHLRFRLNGLYFNREELKEVAYSFIKEGKYYERITGDFLLDWLNDKAYIQVKTSGATGAPKQVLLQKQHMVNSAITSADFFEIAMGNSALHCLPSDFIAGKMMLVRAMILGLELDLVAPSGNPLENVEKNYDFCAMTPFQVQHSLNKLHHLKKLIIGGAPVSKELINSLQNITTRVYETYGMTETVSHISVKPLNGFKNDKKKEVFKTLPNVAISQDNRGCLVIDAPQVSEEIIITNDLVTIISETEFEWLGRLDNVINSGGIKLIPEQLEAKLSEVIPHRFFAAGVPDSALGQKLILVVEGDTSNEELLWKKIKTVKTLTKFEIPKNIYFIALFDETENGKVIRESTLQKILNPTPFKFAALPD